MERVGSIAKLLLWLFVINLGIAFGAGLYESRIDFNHWLVYSPESGYQWNAEAARHADTGLRFWVFVTTVPLTLLTFANLAASYASSGTIRKWWLTAAVAALLDRIFTFSYFIPTMYNLMTDVSMSASEAVETARQWGQLNYIRHALVLIAWLAGLKALTFSNELILSRNGKKETMENFK